MVTTEVFMVILQLHRQGHSMRWIAKKLGIHRNTVKNYITDKKSPLADYERLVLGVASWNN